MTNSNQPLYSGHNSVPVCFLVFSIVFHFAILSQMFCDFFSKSLPSWLKDFDLKRRECELNFFLLELKSEFQKSLKLKVKIHKSISYVNRKQLSCHMLIHVKL